MVSRSGGTGSGSTGGAGDFPPVSITTRDGGRTWSRIATIESGAAEFSYPALVVDRDQRVHCLYTAGRTEIRELSFPLDILGDLDENGAPWEVR